MHVNKKCLVLAEFLMIVVCKAEYDYLDKISSYVRTSSSEIADKLSSYYQEYTKEKSEIKEESYVDERYDETNDYRADNENSCEKELLKCRMLINDIPDETLSRRIVNMLLSRTNFREGDSSFHGRVILDATASELETLKNFGLGISTLREVAPILNNVIKSGEVDEVYESALWINSLTSELFNFIDTYKHGIIIIACLLYLFRILGNMEYDVWLIFSIGLFVVLIVSFVVTWREVLQEENMKNMENMEQVPIQCEPDAMRWTDKIMALVTSAEDCEKYNEAKRNNRPVIKITLSFFRTLNRFSRRVAALSIEIALILIKIVAKYLPLLGLFVVRNIVALKEYSIATLVSLVLALFCCYFYYSRCTKRSKPRRGRNSKNERWMTRFMRKPIDKFEANANTGSRDENNRADVVESTNVTRIKIRTKNGAKQKVPE